MSATRKRLANRHRVTCEMRTAEVFSVVDKLPFTTMIPDLNSYILKHESFERPSYLLKPNICLVFIIKDIVYFIEHDLSENPYDTKRYPFYFLAHKEVAVKVITLHIDEFVKLGMELDDPKCDMTWMFHTGRCGSTTLVQALNAVEDITAISEPQHLALNYLADVCLPSWSSMKSLASSEAFEDLNIACTNYLLKDFQVGQKVCLKTGLIGQYQFILPLIIKRYPHHKVISVHRDGKSSANSMYRGLPPSLHRWFGSIRQLSKLTGILSRRINTLLFMVSGGMICDEKDLLSEENDLFILSYAMWVTNMHHFRVYADKVNKLMTISHDDFQANKKETVTKVDGCKLLSS